MSLPHAVIIAGGRGERLGDVRKADLLLGGIRLVDRVATALGTIASPLMIATGPQDDGRGARVDAIAVKDIAAPVGGPLAGLTAAVASLHGRGIRSGVLLSAPVDTPFLPADYASALLEALGDHPAVFACWRDQVYPPNALWRLESLADLPDRIRRGTAPKSLKALLQGLDAKSLDWTTRSEANPFMNLNTLADLVALGKMARP